MRYLICQFQSKVKVSLWVICLFVTGCGDGNVKPEQDMAKINYHATLGSQSNPVRVYMPFGERQYFSKLLCANGKSPHWYRQGETSSKGPHGNKLSIYQVECFVDDGKKKKHTLYFDMYHSQYKENLAPLGFKLKK